MFKYEEKDGNLVDFKGQVLGINGGDREDANIKREQKDSKKITQEWTIEYIYGGKGGKGGKDDGGDGGEGEGKPGKGGKEPGGKGGDDQGEDGGDDDKSIEDEFGMELGREFHIVTMQSSGRLMDVIGNQVVIKTENKQDSQTWYFDKVSRSIINKKNKQALDMRSTKQLYTYALNTAAANHHQQVFKYTKQNTFLNIIDEQKLIASQGSKPDTEGNLVGTQTASSNPKVHQRWKVVYTTEYKGKGKDWDKEFGFQSGKAFYIVSKTVMNRVVTVSGGNKLVIKTRQDKDKKQLWQFDVNTKTIKSVAENDKSIDARETQVYSRTTDARWYQMFKYKRGWITNEKGKVVVTESGDENAKVVLKDKDDKKDDDQE